MKLGAAPMGPKKGWVVVYLLSMAFFGLRAMWPEASFIVLDVLHRIDRRI
jgi:hypothetical protein